MGKEKRKKTSKTCEGEVNGEGKTQAREGGAVAEKEGGNK